MIRNTHTHNILRRLYPAVLGSFLVIYALSCAPGLLWQDSGLVQYRVLHHDLTGFFGLALAHPLFYYLAIVMKAIPLGEAVHRINLLSALAGAVAVANVFAFMRLWLQRTGPALLAAISLGLCHTFWQHASVAETYTLWSAFFTGELVVLMQFVRTRRTGYLYALALVNGLALSVHNLAGLSFVCYGVYAAGLWRRQRVTLGSLCWMALLWLIGTLPFTSLIALSAVQSGDLVGTLKSAAFGDRWQDAVLNTSMTFTVLKENVEYMLLNFPTLNLALFFVGLAGLCRKKGPVEIRRLVGGLALLFLLFASRYTVADRYAFFIPFYIVSAILIGLGLAVIQDKLALSDRRFSGQRLKSLVLALAVCPVAVYALAPSVFKQEGVTLNTRGDIPYRDDVTYFLRPWKTGYHGADRFAREVLAQVEPNAVIYADTTTVGPLLIRQQTEHQREDVTIVNGAVHSPGASILTAQALDRLLIHRSVYVVSDLPGYCPAFIREHYPLYPKGLLKQVGKRDAADRNACSASMDGTSERPL